MCECGAYITYKAEKNSTLHSDWCPWSLSFIERKCQNFVESVLPAYTGYIYHNGYGYNPNPSEVCGKPAKVWVQYADALGEKQDLCHDCWQKALDGTIPIHDCGTI